MNMPWIKSRSPGDEPGFGGGHFSRRLHLDPPLLFALLALSALGLMILYSASGQNLDMVLRQGVRLAISFAVLLVLAQIPPQQLRLWSPWLFAAGTALLVVVLLIGTVGKGAQRWLNLGLFRFQPSEMMKVAVPMAIAWYLCETPMPPGRVRLLVASLMMALPAALVAKQPDLGTAFLIACAGFFVLFMAGLRWRLIIVCLLLVAAATPLMWHMMHAYQRERILTFLNPESDPLGAGYHIIQSQIAIGSGGLYGKGWLNGTQSHLDFLPERSTDFIFSVFGEEFGLIGAALIVALYLFVTLRGLYIASQAQDTYTRLLAGSLSLTFFVHMFVNVGMVTGLLPVVGLPLPMISYGGTALVSLMAAFGILMSIHTHRRLVPA